jgi:hypothetical protein
MNKRAHIPKERKQRIYMVRTMMVLIGMVLFFAIGGGILYVKNQTTMQTYTSNFMKLQFDYPARYKVNEDIADVLLTNNIGKISFGRSGTFYSTSSEHVKFLSKTHLYTKTLMSQDVNVNGLTGVRLLLDSQGDKKYEYIFVKDNTLYQFEANDPALFSDLDSIAKSFRILQ